MAEGVPTNNRNIAEISLERVKLSKQPTKRFCCGNSFNSIAATRACTGHRLVYLKLDLNDKKQPTNKLKIGWILSEISIPYLIRHASVIPTVGLHL